MRTPVADPVAGTAIVLMLDPPDRLGYAGQPPADQAVTGLLRALRDLWPEAPLLVNRWQPAAIRDAPVEAVGLDVTSPFFTDGRRCLASLAAHACARFAVVRPACTLLPPRVLAAAIRQASDDDTDVLQLTGLPADVFHIVSRRALHLATSAGSVPGATTLPEVFSRLADAGVDWTALGVRIASVAVDAACAHAASRLPSRWWRGVPPLSILAVEAGLRLEAALDIEAQAADQERQQLAQVTPRIETSAPGSSPPVLVVLPSMYQTGAHAAWLALLDALSPRDAAFLVGAATGLAAELTARGFAVFGLRDGLSTGSAADGLTAERALRTVGPRVVHLDGAECAAWGGLAAGRGRRVVQHVRLTVVERFRPAFVHASAIVGVSAPLCRAIEACVPPSVRVEHIADGVGLDTLAPRTPSERPPLDGQSEVACLCVGRVEPAKGQLRVLDIVDALAARRRARLAIVGPCGSDAAYGDAVRDRVDAAGEYLSWTASMRPTTAALYRQAHVVIVGSRNEALGMVGLEAIAAGALLVAQRSTGYEAIVDPSRHEGLLFEADEPATAVADRLAAALDDYPRYEAAAREKATQAFDARATVTRLTALWREIAAQPR